MQKNKLASRRNEKRRWFEAITLVVVVTFLSSDTNFKNDLGEYFIVWNVGQGLWQTWVTSTSCFHFDMGGEFSPLSRIRQTCGKKINQVVYSHWDWDHINQTQKARRVIPNLCVALSPSGPSNERKQKFINVPKCRVSTIQRTQFYDLEDPLSQRIATKKSPNFLSRVAIVDHRVLMTGDSTSGAEKIWSAKISDINSIKILILGHHGSRTSTSQRLLEKLRHLTMAVASARKARYSHPHPLIVKRLKDHQIPLLLTEEWGNLIFEGPM